MTSDPRSQPDLATENARLRSANAKLVEALKSVTASLARREGMSLTVIEELLHGRWHASAPNVVHAALHEACTALAAAEEPAP